MARLKTAGFESASIDDSLSINGTVTVVNTVARSGGWSAKCDSGATAIEARIIPPFFEIPFTRYYRTAFYLTALPSATIAIATLLAEEFFYGGSDLYHPIEVRLASNGQLSCWVYNRNTLSFTQMGSSVTISTNTWHVLELKGEMITDYQEARWRLDGVERGSSTSNSNSSPWSNSWASWRLLSGVGSIRGGPAPPANFVVYQDDIALNDGTGTQQNSWPGLGKVIDLKPVTDVARSEGWLAGAGGTTNLFEAINNVPPIGSATPTDASQVSAQAEPKIFTWNSNTSIVAGGTSASLNLGGLVGHLMIVQIVTRLNTSVTAPSGWTELRSDGTGPRSRLYYRVRQTGDTTSFAWSLGATDRWIAAGVVIGDYADTAYLEAHDGQVNASSTSIVAPSVTTLDESRRIIFFGAINPSSGTFNAPPSGMSEYIDRWTGETNNFVAASVHSQIVGTGATGTRTSTQGSAGQNVGQMVAIKPKYRLGTGRYDFELQSYIEAGIPAGSTILLTRLTWHQGGRGSSAIPTVRAQVFSNPDDGEPNSAPVLQSLVGTWPAGWTRAYKSALHAPSVVLATRPQARFLQEGGGGVPWEGAYAALTVEYLEAAPTPTRPPASRQINQAVNRSAVI